MCLTDNVTAQEHLINETFKNTFPFKKINRQTRKKKKKAPQDPRVKFKRRRTQDTGRLHSCRFLVDNVVVNATHIEEFFAHVTGSMSSSVVSM